MIKKKNKNKEYKKKLKILHIGIHGNIIKNVGDKVHFFLLRKWFDQNFDYNISWGLHQIWKKISYELVNKINKKYDLIIIGGGGLFLKDQKGVKNKQSEWQFNINNNNLNKIKIPIFVYGVGFNKFRGQSNFGEKFKKNIKILYKKSLFFGLRNRGSIKQIKKIIGPKTFFLQPCVTTFINKIEYCNKIYTKKKNEVSFGFASDRLKFRFGDKKKIKFFIKTLISGFIYFKSFKINYVMHKPEDKYFFNFFPQKIKRKVNLVDLSNSSVKKVIKFYRSQKIVFSMRGHNQLISFGCLSSFFSLVTHDKIKYFCSDNNLLKFSADIQKKNFKKKYLNFIKNFETNNQHLNKKIKIENFKNFKKTLKNMEYIKKIIEKIKN